MKKISIKAFKDFQKALQIYTDCLIADILTECETIEDLEGYEYEVTKDDLAIFLEALNIKKLKYRTTMNIDYGTKEFLNMIQ